MRLGLDQKSRQEMRGEPRPEEAGDQKKWRCLGDYLLEDFEGKVVVDGSCFGRHLVVEDWT